MATMNFSIPDDVKQAFDEAFKNENKSAIVAGLMRRAIDERQRKKGDEDFRERVLRRLASNSRTYTDDEIRQIREEERS